MSRNVGWMSDQSGMAVSKFFVFGLNIALLLGVYLNSNIGSYFIGLFSSIKGVFRQICFHPQFCLHFVAYRNGKNREEIHCPLRYFT
jgi:hypothetical protein